MATFHSRYMSMPLVLMTKTVSATAQATNHLRMPEKVIGADDQEIKWTKRGINMAGEEGRRWSILRKCRKRPRRKGNGTVIPSSFY